ncbi:MAG: hypothetical protein RI911_575 [Candidatus Parcubacteria bacterium]|jgi:hypothetical protein
MSDSVPPPDKQPFSRRDMVELVKLWPFLLGATAGVQGANLIWKTVRDDQPPTNVTQVDPTLAYDVYPAIPVGNARIQGVGVAHIAPLLYAKAADMQLRISRSPAVFSEALGKDHPAFGARASAAAIREYYAANPLQNQPGLDAQFFSGITALAATEGKDVIVTDSYTQGERALDMFYACGVPAGLIAQAMYGIYKAGQMGDEYEIPVSQIAQSLKLTRRGLLGAAGALSTIHLASFWSHFMSEKVKITPEDVAYWSAKAQHFDAVMPQNLPYKNRMLWIARHSYLLRDARMARGAQEAVKQWDDIPWRTGESVFWHGANHGAIGKALTDSTYLKTKLLIHPDHALLTMGTVARRYRYSPEQDRMVLISSIGKPSRFASEFDTEKP